MMCFRKRWPIKKTPDGQLQMAAVSKDEVLMEIFSI